MYIGPINLCSILSGLCPFTVGVPYSVCQCGIQIVKVMNIELTHLYSILYGVCLFTVTVRYSVVQFVIQIVKVLNIGLI